MSYNGNGTFVPPTGQPVVSGTVIQSGTFNNLVTDIGNTFNNVLPRDGQAAMAGQLKLVDGSANVPGIAFNSESSTGLFRPSTGTMAFVAGGVENLRIDDSGRVLVGTTSDDGVNKLQINGATKVTGALTVTGALNLAGALAVTGGMTMTGAITAASFTGPLTGNVVGNVSGNVSGNVNGTAANVTGVVALANGGSGAATAAGALANLGGAPIASPTFTGIVGGVNATMVGFTQSGTGAVARSVQEKERDVISVLDFMTPEQRNNAYMRLGTVDSGPQLQLAINAAANKRLLWPSGYVFASAQELIVRTAQVWQGGGKGQMLYPFSLQNSSGTELRTLGSGVAYKTVKTRVLYRGSVSDPQDAPLSALVNVQHQGFEIRDMVVRCNYDPATIWSTPNYLGDNWDVGIFVGCRIHVKIRDTAVVGCWRDSAVRCDVTRGLGLPELFGWDGIQHPVDFQYGGDGCSISEFITWGGTWGLLVRGADPKRGLISYGKDYKTSLVVTIGTLPISGDTVKFGELLFTFGDNPTSGTSVQIGSSTTEAASNLANAANELVFDSLDNEIFRSAVYAPDGALVRTFVREANNTVYGAEFTGSTVSGGRITLSGASPSSVADPAPYYDQGLGTVIADGRGGYGFSDFTIKDSQIFGSDSPTKYARTVIRSDLNWLIDKAGGSFCIDGLAANASRMLQGHRYWNVRFDGSYDPFNVKLGRSHRDDFFGCQFDGTGTTGFFRPDGTSVGTNLNLIKYGPITRVPLLTKRTRLYSQDSTPYKSYFKLDDPGSAIIAAGSGSTSLTGGVLVTGGTVEVDMQASLAANAEMTIRPGLNASGVLRFKKGAITLTQAAIRYRTTDDSLALEAVGGLRLGFAGGSLNDYRTGTWTPTITGVSTVGSNGYSMQVGDYEKIGNVVVLFFRINLSAKDAAMAGNLAIGGLPFPISYTGSNIHSAKLGYYTGFTLGASEDLAVQASSDLPLSLLLLRVSNTAVSTMTVAEVTNTATIRGTIIYRSA